MYDLNTLVTSSGINFGDATGINDAGQIAVTGFYPDHTEHAFRLDPLPTPTPTATPSSTPTAKSLNMSTRLAVGTGDNGLIGGFILVGNQPHRILIRAMGPSVPVTNALSDPTLELHGSSGALLASNDNWQDSQRDDIQATGLAPTNARESAILMTLQPGAYTAVMTGKDGGTGIGLVELYDLDPGMNGWLANISTRGFVGNGDQTMIGGFILDGGNGAGRVLVRALGPSLGTYAINTNVEPVVSNPLLELRDGNGNVIASNDNWKSDQQLAIALTRIPPPNDLESALIADVTAGPYTALVRANGDGAGIGLVEIYNLQ